MASPRPASCTPFLSEGCLLSYKDIGAEDCPGSASPHGSDLGTEGQSFTPLTTWMAHQCVLDRQGMEGVEVKTPPLQCLGGGVPAPLLRTALAKIQQDLELDEEGGKAEGHGHNSDVEGTLHLSSHGGPVSRATGFASASAGHSGITLSPEGAGWGPAFASSCSLDSLTTDIMAGTDGLLTPDMLGGLGPWQTSPRFLGEGVGLREGKEGEGWELGETCEGNEEDEAAGGVREEAAPCGALPSSSCLYLPAPASPPLLPSLPRSLLPDVFVTFKYDQPDALPSSTPPRHLKLYLGPLSSSLGLWESWGLPVHAFASFAQALHASPYSLDTHLTALLPLLPPLALCTYDPCGAGVDQGFREGEREGGPARLWTLPSLSLRPTASLDVRVTSLPCPPSLLPSLLDLLKNQDLSPSFWRDHFLLSGAGQEKVLQEAGREGGREEGLRAVYEFLLSYLLPSSSSCKHWTEEALVDGLRITLYPPGGGEEGGQASVGKDTGTFACAAGVGKGGKGKEWATIRRARGEEVVGFVGEGREGRVSGGREGRRGARRGDRGRKSTSRATTPDDGGDNQGHKMPTRRSQEQGKKKRGRPSKVATAPSSSSSSFSSPSSPPSPLPPSLLTDAYPGRPEPLGLHLPDRGRHVCRIAGCGNEYRWPDYQCKLHGGGRCQYLWWLRGRGEGGRGEGPDGVGLVLACPKFHQSKNSKGELLCGEHCRLTGAVYGEVSRKGKGRGGEAGVKKGKKMKTKE